MNLFQDFRILSCNFILLQESDRQLVKFQHKSKSEKRFLAPEISQVPRSFLFWLYLCSMSGLLHQVEQGMEQQAGLTNRAGCHRQQFAWSCATAPDLLESLI